MSGFIIQNRAWQPFTLDLALFNNKTKAIEFEVKKIHCDSLNKPLVDIDQGFKRYDDNKELSLVMRCASLDTREVSIDTFPEEGADYPHGRGETKRQATLILKNLSLNSSVLYHDGEPITAYYKGDLTDQRLHDRGSGFSCTNIIFPLFIASCVLQVYLKEQP